MSGTGAPSRSVGAEPGASGHARRYSALLILGASVLLYRTVALISGGALHVLRSWVVALTFVEMAVDIVTIGGALRWWMTRSAVQEEVPLRAGAIATLLHAFRVFIFVLGRTGPWVDFDVLPEQRASHRDRWTWTQVMFAASMSVLGVIGVFVVRGRRRKSRQSEEGPTARR